MSRRYAYRARKTDPAHLARPDDIAVYAEPSWVTYHTLSDPTPRLRKEPGGVMLPRVPFTRLYDVRIVSDSDREYISDLEAKIAELEAEKKAFIQQQFLTWEGVGKANADRVIHGKTKAEATPKRN